MRMRSLLLISFLLALQFGAAHAALPPLIDRELIFGDPEIAGAQLSPDGKYITFLRPHKGTRNIWIKQTAEPFDKARPLTAQTRRPIPQYFWSRDSKYVLFVQDNDGDENYNVYAIQPDQSLAADKEVPDSRNITEATGVRAMLYSLPKSEPDIMYVGLNDRDKAWHDLYKVHISTGERTLLRTNTEKITGWGFDQSDRLRLATRVTDNGDNEILRVDPEGFTKVYSCTVLESCGSPRFHKDGKRIYLISNKGDKNFMDLSLLNLQTQAVEFLESDPEKRVDLGGTLFSDVTDEMIATTYMDDKVRIYWKDAQREADYNFLRSQFPNREVSGMSATADEQLVLINARSDVEPGEVHLFDRRTRQLTFQYRVQAQLPRDGLSNMQPIRYRSSDGLEIPAYLTIPKGLEAKSLPLIVVPHGGPWARDTWGANGLTQFFANRGFAVLQPNFRGSTGYGKQFLNAGNGEWGGKMQDDITWGVKHLVREGIVDAKRVAIMGASYGGYATLAGVAFTPDVYAAAVSYVGPSNLLTLLSSFPAYWEAGRTMFYTRMGNPNTPEGKAKLERQSPINSADKIKTPLMVIQGANDPRVTKRESDQIVVALRDRSFPVEYLVAPDEGHGFSRPVNNMAAFAAAEKFLATHVKGVRYQPDMKPEVSQRLAALTVDPKTVELPKLAVATTSAPKPARDLRAGTFNYKTMLEMGGRKVEMSSVTLIKDNGATWSVVETLKSPTGDAVDEGTYAKPSLQLKSRSIAQGPISVRYTLGDGKAQGELGMNGQMRPIAAELGGETFGDGPGANMILATLPLAEGYAAMFRTFNPQNQQIATAQLRVIGSERVTVAAGAFDCFKTEIELASGAKSTAWIDKTQGTIAKVMATGPQLGGGTLTSELQP